MHTQTHTLTDSETNTLSQTQHEPAPKLLQMHAHTRHSSRSQPPTFCCVLSATVASGIAGSILARFPAPMVSRSLVTPSPANCVLARRMNCGMPLSPLALSPLTVMMSQPAVMMRRRINENYLFIGKAETCLCLIGSKPPFV